MTPHFASPRSFYNLILLPRIRDDIAEFKRLNFHLFMALKKALFKPAAFFKGILLPICEVRARGLVARRAAVPSAFKFHFSNSTSLPPLPGWRLLHARSRHPGQHSLTV
jgi:hypothetical protein